MHRPLCTPPSSIVPFPLRLDRERSLRLAHRAVASSRLVLASVARQELPSLVAHCSIAKHRRPQVRCLPTWHLNVQRGTAERAPPANLLHPAMTPAYLVARVSAPELLSVLCAVIDRDCDGSRMPREIVAIVEHYGARAQDHCSIYHRRSCTSSTPTLKYLFCIAANI